MLTIACVCCAFAFAVVKTQVESQIKGKHHPRTRALATPLTRRARPSPRLLQVQRDALAGRVLVVV
jgi:hypothetical protein